MSSSPAAEPAASPRERILTWPLCIFLCGVLVAVAAGLRQRFPTPDLRGAVELLADGDLDGDERRRMLARVQRLGLAENDVYARWAAALAALALRDRAGLQSALAELGQPPRQVPPAAERTFLDLGDTLLRNVVEAWAAEAGGDAAAARRSWGQIAVQSQMTGHALAGELATEAAVRLR